MRRLIVLAIFTFVASLTLAPAALAQDQYEQEDQAEVVEEQIEEPQEGPAQNVAEGETEAALEEQVESQQQAEISPQEEAALEQQAEAATPQPVAPTPQPVAETPQAVAGEQTTMTEVTMIGETTQPLPSSGGMAIGSPSLLLSVAALLLGSGVLTLAYLRRR